MRKLSSAVGIAVAILLVSPLRVDAQSAVCGNGIREPGEQCDDGNTENLDGCSSQCLFEQVQRMNQLKLQAASGTAPCTANALGQAFTGLALSQLQNSLDANVMSGSMSILLHMVDLTDLTGTTQSPVHIGITPAGVVNGTSYNGNNDLDWWYVVLPSVLDANRVPISQLTGSIAGTVLTAGPGSASIPLALGSPTPTLVHMSSLNLSATDGTSSTPSASSGGPPGHVASEHLDPLLTSFATMGSGTTGVFCGNISAASLAATPVPSALVSGGTACTAGYTASNSLLDVLVDGCVYLVFINLVNKTQPDSVDPDAAVAGAGGLYTLSTNASHVVSSCKDKNGVGVTLSTCLNAAAYSAYFKFSADRVIAHPCPDAPVATNDGPACPNGTVQLTAQGPAVPVGSYLWTGPNKFSSSLQNPPIANVSAADAGTYSVTVTVGGCVSPPATTDVVVIDPTAPLTITAPGSVTASVAGFQASVPLVSGSTYSWGVTNGTITSSTTSNAITFTAGTGGDVSLSVSQTYAGGCSRNGGLTIPVIPETPPGVTATGVSGTEIDVNWGDAAGAASYVVQRVRAPGVFDTFPTGATFLADSTGLTANAAYLYSVKSIGPTGHESSYSAPNLAVAAAFIPVATGTTITAAQIQQLRDLQNAIEQLAGITPLTTWTNPVLDSTIPIRATHIGEIRSALNTARASLLLAPAVYTTPVAAGGAPIQAADIIDLQTGMK